MINLALTAPFVSVSVSAVVEEPRLRGGERGLSSVSVQRVRMPAVQKICLNRSAFLFYDRSNIIQSPARACAPSKTNTHPHGSRSSSLTMPPAAKKVGSKPNVLQRHHLVLLKPIQNQTSIYILFRLRVYVALWMITPQVI